MPPHNNWLKLLCLLMTSRIMASKSRTIAWFRNDLRVHDNILISNAVERSKAGDDVLCVYCFDPRHFSTTPFGSIKCNSFRSNFLIESVSNLRKNLKSLDNNLLVAYGKPEDVIPNLTESFEKVNVLVQKETAYEEFQTEVKVEKALKRKGFNLNRLCSGASLYHLDDLPYGSIQELPDTFTIFREKVEKKCSIRPMLPKVKPGDMKLATVDTSILNDTQSFDYLPTVEELIGTSPATAKAGKPGVMTFTGGEDAALNRLKTWMWDDDNLKEYFDIRNGMLGERYSSKFSPWLAHGCISPRYIVSEIRKYEAQRVANKSTYWLIFELIWRDFFRFLCLKYDTDIFMLGGAHGVSRPWVTDMEKFNRWKNGMTGVPLVDANMRELKQTGWMSNRGRQNVASYLVLELGFDWRYGADHFESLLLDHDVYSNYGNWNAAAGLTGGRINRFNMAKQSRDYDANGDYIRYWIPELQKVPAPEIFEPWLMSNVNQQKYNVRIDNSGEPNTYPMPLSTAKFNWDDNRSGGNSSGNGTRGSNNRSNSNKYNDRKGGGGGNSSSNSSSSSRSYRSEDSTNRRRGNKIQHY